MNEKDCYLKVHNFNDIDKLVRDCPYSMIDDKCSYKGNKNCFYL